MSKKPDQRSPLKAVEDVSSIPFDKTPDNVTELINAYGTYEIQPTADTENEYPAIAQGNPKFAQRPLEFKRSPKDKNGKFKS